MKDFNKTIDLYAGYAEPFVNRGIGHISSGNYGSVCDDFRKACKLVDCAYPTWAQENGDG